MNVMDISPTDSLKEISELGPHDMTKWCLLKFIKERNKLDWGRTMHNNNALPFGHRLNCLIWWGMGTKEKGK